MAKHNVKVTKGSFKLVGKVKLSKDPKRFFKHFEFDSGTEKNQLTFGIETSESNESFVSLEGFTQKTAKFNKFDVKTRTNLKEEVSWNSRFDFEKDGYAPMFGTKIALNGKDEMVVLFQYDACEELKESLIDGMSVYVEGNTKFSHYSKDGEVKRYKTLDLTKIYKQDKDLDFGVEDFVEKNMFEQEIIFMEIEKEMDFETNKETGRFIVLAKIVTSESVEDTQFIIADAKLASLIRKNLKPYNAIKVSGRLMTQVIEEEAVEADTWGDDESFDEKPHEVKFREWVITKAYPDTLDKETYSEAVLASVTQAEDDFGNTVAVEDDNDDVWG